MASILSTLKISLKSQNPLVLFYFSLWHQFCQDNTKNPTRESCIFSFVPFGTTSFAWHTQHHLSFSSTSLPLAAQMNDVALCANDVLRNDVMLRINDVALCANGIKAVRLFAEILLIFNQKYDFVYVFNTLNDFLRCAICVFCHKLQHLLII